MTASRSERPQNERHCRRAANHLPRILACIPIDITHPATHLMLHLVIEFHESLLNIPEAGPQMIQGLAGTLLALAREASKQLFQIFNPCTEIPQSPLHRTLHIRRSNSMMVIVRQKRHRYFPE
jgi:hypothetical protein